MSETEEPKALNTGPRANTYTSFKPDRSATPQANRPPLPRKRKERDQTSPVSTAGWPRRSSPPPCHARDESLPGRFRRLKVLKALQRRSRLTCVPRQGPAVWRRPENTLD